MEFRILDDGDDFQKNVKRQHANTKAGSDHETPRLKDIFISILFSAYYNNHLDLLVRADYSKSQSP